MVRLSLSLLGAFDAQLDSEPLTFATDKAAALLIYLAVEADHPHHRNALAGLLWPDQPQRNARHNLRQALSHVHKALTKFDQASACIEEPFLTVTRETLRFNPNSDHVLDVARFDKLYENCKAHRHRRLGACRPCLLRLQEIAALHQAEFLEQLFLSDSEVFEEWALFRREWHHLQAIETLAILARYEEQRGAIAQARDYVQRQVTLEPWREEAHRHLMRLLTLDGQYSAALAQYETCRRILLSEFDVAPAAETTALFNQIKAARQQSKKPEVRHPLFPEPSRSQIPILPTPFVGREFDRAAVAERLADPDCRLITLIGTGGIGKTRLAVQVAADHVGLFADGVVFVPLATIKSRELIATAIADALGLPTAPGIASLDQVVNHLRNKEVLLVLDNLEQAVACCDILIELLRSAPAVVILVTSRERLQLQEEWLYWVEGLPYPDTVCGEDIAAEHYDALTLFKQRALQVQRQFALTPTVLPDVIRICQLVEGMPLGIELAAAAVIHQSCAEIAVALNRTLYALTTSLRNVPSRHRSLRATFDYSWE
ncbi:MAG: NB-ARC domain-containing protein [Anaerolineae bacterium]|nr:NB-ARC domain-containing protein [Anaerolineae bacterium]